MINLLNQEKNMDLLEDFVNIFTDIYLSEGIDCGVSRQELNHLFYLSNNISNLFGLQFIASHYGLISEQLNRILDSKRISFDIKYPYEEDSDQFWHALTNSYRNVMKNINIVKHINTLRAIIEGFCSPFGLKLLATTIYFCKEKNEVNASSLEKLEYLINKNFPQKNKFTCHHIDKALYNLKPILSITNKPKHTFRSTLLPNLNISIPPPSGASPIQKNTT